ncbi:hypothetical protein [Lactiplantibacillus daowaiensis]|uniref:Uncharacterized protein n=1 Tax=Lactiplantibacillus daowaiensis TaxID=2559918 RepID=A0ABW1RWM7_9LACO|nr:hypothetical protein [Lactiplantibacillus daowaiensis]
MPKWTARLEVTNNTNNTLQVMNKTIHPKSKTLSFPMQIVPGETGIYEVYTGTGVPYGPDFSVTLATSVADTISYHVDMPYPENKDRHNSCETTGRLRANGLRHIKPRVHDWTDEIKITTIKVETNSNDLDAEDNYEPVP